LVDGLGWHFEGVGNACLCLVFLALSSSVERRVVSCRMNSEDVSGVLCCTEVAS
jgi:hypothetical protein